MNIKIKKVVIKRIIGFILLSQLIPIILTIIGSTSSDLTAYNGYISGLLATGFLTIIVLIILSIVWLFDL